MHAITNQKPSMQFLIGLGIGIGLDMVVQLFFSFVFQLIIFATLPQSPNVNIIGALALFLPLATFIATLIILQKSIKSKFFTMGVAAGWLGLLVIFNIMMLVVF